MDWTVERAADAEHDRLAIFRHHLRAHHELQGLDLEAAADIAERRIREVDAATDRLARTPRIGTRHPGGLRHVTFDRTVVWFTLDEATRTVRVLGLFHGGQDHLGRMMARLGAGGPEPSR